jgi:hypothetical protein
MAHVFGLQAASDQERMGFEDLAGAENGPHFRKTSALSDVKAR